MRPRPLLSSMKRMTEVWSISVWSTKLTRLPTGNWRHQGQGLAGSFRGTERPSRVYGRHDACNGVSVMKRRGSGPGMDGTYIVRAIALCVLVVLLAFLVARRSTG